MTLVLDAGAVSELATNRLLLAELRRRGHWPAQVASVVLVESLTGDHRRDVATNRFLRSCQVRDVDEPICRHAARLRTATGRASRISATDAVVVALAATYADAVVVTSDPRDITALVEHATAPVAVVRV